MRSVPTLLFIEVITHKNTYIHSYIHTYIHAYIQIPPWEDQCEWHRMTRMTGPDYAVMCNLINIHTCIHTCIHTNIHTKTRTAEGSAGREECVSPSTSLIRGSRDDI